MGIAINRFLVGGGYASSITPATVQRVCIGTQRIILLRVALRPTPNRVHTHLRLAGRFTAAISYQQVFGIL